MKSRVMGWVRTWVVGVLAACGVILPATGAESAPMTFRLATSGGNCGVCTWVAAEGEIQGNSAELLEAYLAEKDITWRVNIVFDSPGGDLSGGMKLGEVIRRRRLNTWVARTDFRSKDHPDFDAELEGVCASACALAYLGGAARTLPEGSKIGVHQFASTQGSTSEGDTQAVVALIAAYLGRMDVSRDLILPIGLVGPRDIYWLSRAEIERFNVVTDRTVAPEGAWQIAESGGRVVLQALQEQTDGRRILYRLTCSAPTAPLALVVAIPVEGTAAGETRQLATSITGMRFWRDGVPLGPSMPASGSATGQSVAALGYVSQGMVAGLSRSPPGLELWLDMPRGLSLELGGWSHPLPRKNLTVVLPLLLRNC
jgi:hypothetical protein